MLSAQPCGTLRYQFCDGITHLFPLLVFSILSRSAALGVTISASELATLAATLGLAIFLVGLFVLSRRM